MPFTPTVAPSEDAQDEFNPIRSLRIGLAQTVSGIGGGVFNTLDMVYGLLPGDQRDSIFSQAADTIDQWSYEWLAGGYTPHRIESIKDILNPIGFSQALLEYGPITAALMGITVASAGLGTAAIASTTIGEAIREIDEANPDLDDYKRFALGTVVGGLNAVLERIAIGRFIGDVSKKTIRQRIVKGLVDATIEATTEGVQEDVLYLGQIASGRGDATILGALAEVIKDPEKLAEAWSLFQEAALAAIPVSLAAGAGEASGAFSNPVQRDMERQIEEDLGGLDAVIDSPMAIEDNYQSEREERSPFPLHPCFCPPYCVEVNCYRTGCSCIS